MFDTDMIDRLNTHLLELGALVATAEAYVPGEIKQLAIEVDKNEREIDKRTSKVDQKADVATLKAEPDQFHQRRRGTVAEQHHNSQGDGPKLPALHSCGFPRVPQRSTLYLSATMSGTFSDVRIREMPKVVVRRDVTTCHATSCMLYQRVRYGSMIATMSTWTS